MTYNVFGGTLNPTLLLLLLLLLYQVVCGTYTLNEYDDDDDVSKYLSAYIVETCTVVFKLMILTYFSLTRVVVG